MCLSTSCRNFEISSFSDKREPPFRPNPKPHPVSFPKPKALGKEMDESSEGERLIFPFVDKVYDISNAALFYAHNGRIESAQEKLNGQSAPPIPNTSRRRSEPPPPNTLPPLQRSIGVIKAKATPPAAAVVIAVEATACMHHGELNRPRSSHHSPPLNLRILSIQP